MNSRVAILLLASQLAAGSTLAGPARQVSLDTTEAFLGIVIHGPRAGQGLDTHQDVFGGANWSNDTSLLIFQRRPGPPQLVPPMAPVDRATLVDTTVSSRHTVAPHGEQANAFSWATRQLDARPGGRQRVVDRGNRLEEHEDHIDHTGSALLGISNNNALTGVVGIVAAVHKVPSLFVFLDYGTLRAEPRAKPAAPVAGLVALVASQESRRALVGVALVDSDLGAVESLVVRAGRPADPGVTLFEVSGEKLLNEKGLGVVGAFETRLTEKQTEALREAGAHAVVGTREAVLVARIDSLQTEAAAARIAPYCRATVPVVVPAGRQGLSADACRQAVAMAEAFDRASDQLCGDAGCEGECRLPEAACKPQIPMLPERENFTCWQNPMEECEGGAGWRCFWQSPRWFSCDCSCRG